MTLRPITLGDVGPRYVSWLNDPAVNRYLESRFGPHTEESVRAYVKGLLGDPANAFMAILENETGEHVGNIKLGPIHPFHRSGDIGILLGEPRTWGKGYATEAIALLCQHAFATLGLHKVTAGCYHTNVGSIRAFQRAGFAIEGVRRSQFESEGGRVDHVLLGLVNKEMSAP